MYQQYNLRILDEKEQLEIRSIGKNQMNICHQDLVIMKETDIV